MRTQELPGENIINKCLRKTDKGGGIMEKYVVSRELAQKLKEAGFPQKKTWSFWTKLAEDQNWFETSNYNFWRDDASCAAPMTDELLEQLPDKVDGKYVEVILSSIGQSTHFARLAVPYLGKFDKKKRYGESYQAERDEDDEDITWNLPNTLAELWLWLRNNGYALPCGINQTKVSA